MTRRRRSVLLRAIALAALCVTSAGCADEPHATPESPQHAAEPFRADSTQVDGCVRLGSYGDSVDCLAQAYGNVAARSGPARATLAVERALASPDEPAELLLAENCHRVMHALGAATLVHFDGAVDEALAAATPLCLSGFHHGVIEHAVAFAPGADAGAACARLSPPDECLHGLGHGFAISSGYHRDRTLQRCHDLARAHERPCLGGAMMELFMVLRPGSPAASGRIDCAGIDDDLQTMCVRALGAGLVWSSDLRDPPTAAARACGDLEPADRAACAAAVGETIGERSAGDELRADRACRGMGDLRRDCERGVRRFVATRS